MRRTAVEGFVANRAEIFSVSSDATLVCLLRIATFCQPCHNVAHGMKELAQGIAKFELVPVICCLL